MRINQAIALAAIVGIALSATAARAVTLPLGPWQVATNPTNYTGGPGTVLTPGVDTTTFSLSNNSVDGFTTGLGFFSTFDSYTLGDTYGVGETIRLSFDVTFDADGAAFSNNSFRFGLFNHNGQAAGDANNWLGYNVHASGTSGSLGAMFSRNVANDNPFASGTDAVELAKTNSVDTTVAMGNGTYSVQMDLTLVSPTEVTLSAVATGIGNDYEWASAIDAPDAFATGQISFDRVGLQQTNALNGQIESATYSNFAVTVVPEPNALFLSGVGIAGLAWLRRRKVFFK